MGAYPMFHRMIPVGLAACLAVFASGCAGRMPEVSKPLAAPSPEPQGKPPEPCPPLPQRLRTETAALTPVTPDMTRQLILSEIEQSKRIADLVAAYERCRRGRQR